jgi:hypothetical protein
MVDVVVCKPIAAWLGAAAPSSPKPIIVKHAAGVTVFEYEEDYKPNPPRCCSTWVRDCSSHF